MDHICLYQLNSPCLLQAQDCLFCFPKGSNWSRLSVQTDQEIGSRAALKNGGSGSKHNIYQSLNSGRTFFKPLKKEEKNTWKDSSVWKSQKRSRKVWIRNPVHLGRTGAQPISCLTKRLCRAAELFPAGWTAAGMLSQAANTHLKNSHLAHHTTSSCR